MVASSDPNRNRKSVGGQDCSSCLEPLFQAFRLKSFITWSAETEYVAITTDKRRRRVQCRRCSPVALSAPSELMGDRLRHHGDGFVLGGALRCECCAGN